MNNITLALLTLFIIIILLNKYDSFVEGMENIQTPDTIGEENVPITGAQQVLTKDAVKQKIEDRISDLKAKAQSSQGEQTQPAQTSDSNTGTGMDKEDIKNAIQSISASSIPVDKNTFNSTDNVQPSTSSMLTNKASLTEGFCPCAASIVF
jgi:fructose-specific phosphotransferase system component IIB